MEKYEPTAKERADAENHATPVMKKWSGLREQRVEAGIEDLKLTKEGDGKETRLMEGLRGIIKGHKIKLSSSFWGATKEYAGEVDDHYITKDEAKFWWEKYAPFAEVIDKTDSRSVFASEDERMKRELEMEKIIFDLGSPYHEEKEK